MLNHTPFESNTPTISPSPYPSPSSLLLPLLLLIPTFFFFLFSSLYPHPSFMFLNPPLLLFFCSSYSKQHQFLHSEYLIFSHFFLPHFFSLYLFSRKSIPSHPTRYSFRFLFPWLSQSVHFYSFWWENTKRSNSLTHFSTNFPVSSLCYHPMWISKRVDFVSTLQGTRERSIVELNQCAPGNPSRLLDLPSRESSHLSICVGWEHLERWI